MAGNIYASFVREPRHHEYGRFSSGDADTRRVEGAYYQALHGTRGGGERRRGSWRPRFVRPERLMSEQTAPSAAQTEEELVAIAAVKARPPVTIPMVYIDDIQTRVKYRESYPKDKITSLHRGQCKLFWGLLEFMNAYADLATDVVYIGAAPGKTHPLILEMFPKHTIYSYDPRPLETKHARLIEKTQLFLDEDAKAWIGKKILFVSDIRSVSVATMSFREKEDSVRENNALQERILRSVQPEAAMLKFRFPFIDQAPQKVIAGVNRLQCFAPRMSTETRRYVLKDEIDKSVTEDPIEHEQKMFYFNIAERPFGRFRRPFEFKRALPAGYDDNSYDANRALWIATEYAKKYRPDKPVEDTVHWILERSEKIQKIRPEIAPDARYAYVMLVFGGDTYVPGAIVTAKSLRMTETKHDIVCLVTKDVSKTARAQLAEVFTRVVEVDYLEYKSKPMASQKQKEQYSAWMARSYTKWQCLGLVEYTKVCFLDADLLILRNIDHIFAYKSPVGCFVSDWIKDSRGAVKNYFTAAKTGDQIEAKTVLRALEDGFVSNGHLIVLKTGKDQLDGFKRMMEGMAAKGLFGIGNNASMVDEQSIAQFKSGVQKRSWTHLGAEYNTIAWHMKDYLAADAKFKPYLLHFHGVKPWTQERGKWPIDEMFWAFACQAAADSPVIKKIFVECVDDDHSTQCEYCTHVLTEAGVKVKTDHRFIAGGRVICAMLR